MATAQKSNYPNIELAIAHLMQRQWNGMPVEIGDFSKITLGTPCGVISHGELKSPLQDRKPSFEYLHWTVPIHIFFDYTNDAEAHALFRQYRMDLIALFAEHRYLDDPGNPNYPAGFNGHAIDSKIIRAVRPLYFTLDGKDYVQSTYELWVSERVSVTY